MGDTPDYDRNSVPEQPGEDAVSSHDAVIADLRAWDAPGFTRNVEILLASRKAYGLEKYDVILHKDNGRDMALDAEDEVLDLSVYLRTWMDARPELEQILFPIYRDVLWALVTVHALRTDDVAPHYFAKTGAPMVPLDVVRMQLRSQAAEKWLDDLDLGDPNVVMRATCVRCEQPIERVEGEWRHADEGEETPCPRACPPEVPKEGP